MQQCAPLFAVRLATRLIVTCSAMVLILSMTEHALALDCLAYKPERAQGQWHADVISGKICWYGPNWRSFLPKSKARVESSLLANSKPKMEPVKPDSQVVKTDVENRKPDVQIENSKPNTEAVKIENSKPDARIENSKAEISAVSTPSLAEAVVLDRAQESSGLRKPTSGEATKFINAAALTFEPKPAVLNAALPKMMGEPESMTNLLVAFSIIALGTIGLVTLIMRGRGQQHTDQEQSLGYTLVDDDLAPPLQPNAEDEHVPLEKPEHGFLTQSVA